MITYEDFCASYDLDADAPDSLNHYEQYREAYEHLMLVVSRISNPEFHRNGSQNSTESL